MMDILWVDLAESQLKPKLVQQNSPNTVADPPGFCLDSTW